MKQTSHPLKKKKKGKKVTQTESKWQPGYEDTESPEHFQQNQMQPLWEIWILESSKWGHQKAQQFYSQVSYQRNWQHVLTLMLVCALSGSTTDMDGKRIQVPNN